MRLLLFVCCFLTTQSLLAQTPYAAQLATHREHYKAEFLTSSGGPLRTKEAVSKLQFYPADSTYRVTATVLLTPRAEPINVPTSGGTSAPEQPYAVLSFTLRGKPCELTVYRSLNLANNPAYRDYLFLPFKDATSGKDTYGGGRYMDLRTGDIQNGQIVLDFNKAYNPYCAYSSGYHCPIPPRTNWLPIALEAGEKTYPDDH